MSEKREGTFRLDGIIEGPLPASPDAGERLRQWARTAAEAGVHFSIEQDGGTFSALAMDKAVSSALLGNVTDAVAAQIDELLRLFPPTQRCSVLSTVRSMEYRPGQEVQTLYAVGPDGEVATEQRTVDANTIAPPRPLTRREQLKLAGVSVLVLLALFGLSAIFVDYGQMWRNVRDKAAPMNVDEIEWVVTPELGRYLAVEKKEFPSGTTLELTLHRTPDFPRTPDALDKADKAAKTLPEQLALDAVARGYLRGEWYDKEGKYITQIPVHIKPLTGEKIETLAIELPVPRNVRPTRFVLTY